jgi:hypothetical protein
MGVPRSGAFVIQSKGRGQMNRCLLQRKPAFLHADNHFEQVSFMSLNLIQN